MQICQEVIFLPFLDNGCNRALWDVQSVEANYETATGFTGFNLGISQQQGVNIYAMIIFMFFNYFLIGNNFAKVFEWINAMQHKAVNKTTVLMCVALTVLLMSLSVIRNSTQRNWAIM